MKATFSDIILGMFLILYNPAKANEDFQEDGGLQVPPANVSQQSSFLNETIPLVSLEDFPSDLLLSIFKQLNVNTLGRVALVSTCWKKVSENPHLWSYVGLQYYEDYLSEEDLKENSKKKVVNHYLSVIVNTTKDFKKIERFIEHYKLVSYSTKNLINLDYFINDITDLLSLEELVAQGNKKAIEKKINDLQSQGKLKELREFNERLIERGDSGAIERKLKALLSGGDTYLVGGKTYYAGRYGYYDSNPAAYSYYKHPTYGYEKDPIAAREFNDALVEQGNLEAIKRKIEGLTEGKYGYEKNPIAAKEFNDALVAQGNSDAIKWKIEGLAWGTFNHTEKSCYEKDPVAAREFNDALVQQGDSKTIDKKVDGLKYGRNGYEKDPIAAMQLNDVLVEQGNLEAIKWKITGLTKGEYGYEKDPVAARELNDALVKQGNSEAIIWKIEGLTEGKYGYEKDLIAAQEFNQSLIQKGKLEAIKIKLDVSSILSRNYYDTPIELRAFVEDLSMSTNPLGSALGRYIKAFALKYGSKRLGYERDHDEAIKYIKLHNVPY